MIHGSKFANELHFAVKGHLIPKEYNQSDIYTYIGYNNIISLFDIFMYHFYLMY